MFCGSPESVRCSPLSTKMGVTSLGLPKACGAVSPKHADAKRLRISLVMRSCHVYDPLLLAASCSNREPISSYSCCNARSRSSSAPSPSTTNRLSRWANPLPALSTLSGGWLFIPGAWGLLFVARASRTVMPPCLTRSHNVSCSCAVSILAISMSVDFGMADVRHSS